ncbi:hypothetical protein [Phormidium sp. CCY1219]|nr:hypothetical protein [Phormidium sp. CCY1219]
MASTPATSMPSGKRHHRQPVNHSHTGEKLCHLWTGTIIFHAAAIAPE